MKTQSWAQLSSPRAVAAASLFHGHCLAQVLEKVSQCGQLWDHHFQGLLTPCCPGIGLLDEVVVGCQNVGLVVNVSLQMETHL